jgi:leader peptidase (prepilin peptidase)/N-methyltransferase
MIRILGTIFAGLLGLAFGSFLNVCLSRWPAGESVVKPRSHCRNCDHTLTWWENFPLLSWIVLLGRCRNCKAPIGWRYPLVEFAVAAAWALIASQPYPDVPTDFIPSGLLVFTLATRLLSMALIWVLLALAMLDAEHLWLPDFLTLPGIAVGLIVTAAQPFVLTWLTGVTGLQLDEGFSNNRFGLWRDALFCILSAAAAALLILLIRWLYRLIRHREGIGLGDAKLMALLAAWLGLPGALLAFVLGAVIGAITALTLLAVPGARRSPRSWAATKLPLGTFLCIGGIVSSLWGEAIIRAYGVWAGF